MGQRRRLLLKLLALAMLTPGLGCTRRFFRHRADKDVEALLTEKNVFEPWRIENWHVYADPRARFADPSDPDHPPLPPDDPAAQYLSPNPQRPKNGNIGRIEGTGYLDVLAAWDAMNRAELPPQLPATPEGTAATMTPTPPDPCPTKTYLLNLPQCCELGLFNSRDYQDQRENLYLTALPVSLQRYSFAAQFFALGNATFQSAGDQAAVPGQRWIGGGQAGFNKVLPTGATLLAQLANNFAFDLTNGNPQISVSNLTLQLAQPLLRGGGRAVTLENLTQAERSLLYQIRTYARFRKGFFVNVAAGRGGGGGAAALDPSFGALATQLNPQTGYWPTLRLIANLEIDRENVLRFEQFLKLLEALAEGGEVAQQNVDLIKGDLLTARQQVLTDQLQIRNALDSFKIQLGMPPTLDLELDAAPIRPIREQLNRFQQPVDQYRATVEIIADSDPDVTKRRGFRAPDQVAQLRGRLKTVATESDLVKGTPFSKRILELWGSWERLSNDELEKRLVALRQERRSLLAEKAKIESQGKEPPESIEQRIDVIESEVGLGGFEKDLREYERQPWRQLADPDIARLRQQSLYSMVANSFELLLIEARAQRFEIARTTWPELPGACVEGVNLITDPLEAAYAKAAQVAMTNRLDLMNARGEVVDRWRQIAVRSNALLGVLDVGYSLTSPTPAGTGQAANFSTSRTTQQLTLNGQLPLVRRLERNNYRTALINYQRERRALQQTEDNILNTVRSELRQLRVLAETYKIQQQQVALRYTQVEQALENFRQPQPAGAVGPPGGGQGASTTLANTQALQGAQRGLNGALSQIYQTWINYHTLRMQLFFDLEIMPLDARGVWIDDHATQDCNASCQPAVAPANEPVVPAPTADTGPVQWRARTVTPASAKR